ncbi:MAG: tRNA pseudouridine(38-40) synthase TruA [Clostridia bacterium]
MRNIAISLAYDGAAFHGWQIQENAISVQGTIQKIARTITKEDIKLIGCGRTDSGVHATRYIAGFRTECNIPPERIARAFNCMLPDSIAVFAAQDMPRDFHPIRSCLQKEYTYKVYNSKERDPFCANRELHWEGALPLETMREAAKYFVGEHDFAAMQSSGGHVKTTVRTVFSYDVCEKAGGVSFIVNADGFLYNMARTMAGTLLAVAQGKLAVRDIPEILESRDRRRAGPTAPAHALYMTDVRFEGLNI